MQSRKWWKEEESKKEGRLYVTLEFVAIKIMI
jgi:hypothetical protein